MPNNLRHQTDDELFEVYSGLIIRTQDVEAEMNRRGLMIETPAQSRAIFAKHQREKGIACNVLAVLALVWLAYVLVTRL